MIAIFTRIFKLSSLKSESSKLRKQLQDKDRQLEHVIRELSELRNIREVGY
jgi:predicted RNase H-like nuclease (RuvC/YqgF family)